jgi:Response regulator containing a CheY-like receiver domain and an HTH DNA-binding domain
MRVGVRCFDMLAWLVVLAVGNRNPLALLPTFAIVRCMSALGTDVGAIAGHTTNDLVGASSETAMLIAETVLFAFVAFLWLGFRKFSFSDTIRGVAGLEMRDPQSLRENGAARSMANDGSQEGPSAAGTTLGEAPSEGECAGAGAGASAGASIEERCTQLGAEGGLTERETEIFAMLARGRNGQYVMDHYVISRNTVKSHVKHIYAKLGVHSQQELIDLVERYE